MFCSDPVPFEASSSEETPSGGEGDAKKGIKRDFSDLSDGKDGTDQESAAKKTKRSGSERERHNAIERKRKQSIKKQLVKLGELLPAKASKHTHYTILKTAVEYVKELQEIIENLQQENKELKYQNYVFTSGGRSMPPPTSSNSPSYPRTDLSPSSASPMLPLSSAPKALPTPASVGDIHSFNRRMHAFPPVSSGEGSDRPPLPNLSSYPSPSASSHPSGNSPSSSRNTDLLFSSTSPSSFSNSSSSGIPPSSSTQKGSVPPSYSHYDVSGNTSSGMMHSGMPYAAYLHSSAHPPPDSSPRGSNSSPHDQSPSSGGNNNSRHNGAKLEYSMNPSPYPTASGAPGNSTASLFSTLPTQGLNIPPGGTFTPYS